MSTTNSFKNIAKIFEREGIYSNDESDNGKETVFGISRVKNPSWSGWEIVDKIPVDKRKDFITNSFTTRNELMIQARNFYVVWWRSLYLDEMPNEIASEIFDTSINQGKKAAISYLQESINLLTDNNLDVDGKIGNHTKDALHEFLSNKEHGRTMAKNIRVLVVLLNYYQAEKYVSIVNENPSQKKFIYGWILNRVDI